MTSINIHTINARGNVFLSVVKDCFNIPDFQMHSEIKSMHVNCCKILSDKGIKYDDLKSSLIPQCKRKEVALIFDRECIETGWYGKKVMDEIIPLLDKNLSCSVLAGDFIENTEHAREVLGKTIGQNIEYSNRYYIIYINNLSDRMIDTIDKGLQGFYPFVKLVDTTYNSLFKVYLSSMLCNVFIKHKKIILQGHEEDRNHLEDVNTIGYSFEENDFICRSIQEPLYGVFLTYKIERPVFDAFSDDTSFSLNSVDPRPLDISNLTIQIPAEKLEYLKKEKGKIFENAGINLDLLSVDLLSKMISDNIHRNYIYNLSFNDYGDKKEVKFNIIIELSECFKIMCSLAYKQNTKQIRLITMC